MRQQRFDRTGWGRAFEDEGSAAGAELDGLRVVFDQKVGLHPANLQKSSEPAARRAPVRMGAGLTWRGKRDGLRSR